MASQSSGQKKATKMATQAPATIQAAEAAYLSDPKVIQIMTNLSEMLSSPGTMTPQLVSGLKQNVAAEAHSAANTARDEMLARLGQTGNVRGGSAVRGTNDIASRLGETIATGNRQLDVMAATQNRQDQVQALNAALQFLTQRYSFPQNVANAQLGSAGVLGNIAAQPTPLQTLGQGIGGLAGNLVSAGGAAGGISKVFK